MPESRPASPSRRRIRAPWVAVLVVTAACGAPSSDPVAAGSTTVAPAPVSTSSVVPVPVPVLAAVESGPARSPLAGSVADVGSAVYDPADHAGRPAPVGLSIPTLEIADAPVIPVGVQPEGDLDVPAPEVVGWYRFGPTIGEPGATVLAAHVNYNRVAGVFRYLRDLEPGATVSVTSSDASVRSYVVDEIRLVDKDGIADLGVWRREGPEALVLVTCGGRYDDERRRYEENVVVFATPTEAG